MSDRATGFREIDEMENKIQRPNADYFKLKEENKKLKKEIEELKEFKAIIQELSEMRPKRSNINY